MTDLEARYGTRRRPRWLLPVLAGIIFVAALAWVLWVATADKPFQVRVYSYEVVSDQQTTVRLDVQRPQPVGLECTVYAQGVDHSIVGERTVIIPASTETSLRKSITVKTERRAVTGVLKACMTVDPAQP